MSSVSRIPTSLVSLLAATFLATAGLITAVPASSLAQSGDNEESAEESPDEETTSQENAQQSEGDEAAEKSTDKAEDEEAGETDQQTGDDQQTGESAEQPGDEPAEPQKDQPSETNEQKETGDDPMQPAGEGAMSAPGEVGEPEESGQQSAEQDETDSPISDLAESQSDNDGFEPVEDIEEEMLQEITPTKVYPYLEWDGFFRVRSDAMYNLDLDTEGTSAILPPAETYKPDVRPADEDAEFLWSTNMNLRFDPTLHISESLRVHMEADLLDNVVLGSLSDQRLTGYRGGVLPDPSRTVTSGNQISPRESDVFQNAVRINEAYGEINFFLGSIRAGRMDFDWGLGTYANGGDCIDCDYGDHVDRLQWVTQPPLPLDLYTSAAIDFPDQGPTSTTADRVDGQPYDLGQIDDARQYTFSIFRKPVTKEDREERQKRLKEDQKPSYNGGVLFSYRQQKGRFFDEQTSGGSGNGSGGGDLQNARLVYRGLNMFVPDVWFRMLYHPDSNTKIRVELEGTGVFGSVENTTDQQLTTSETNCFAEENKGIEECTTIQQQGGGTRSTDSGISQLGGALESEFYFGGPVRFGLNAGYASGGDSPNYGYGAQDSGGSLDFYRFDPNYHVDLILFREVIGTVTNAYYANPYVQARFFETPDRRLELQFDTIVSRAANQRGTPAGDSNWLGVELDGAVRYLQTETFRVGLEGGVLFPLGGLEAVSGRPRLTRPGTVSNEFPTGSNATIGWTVQSNLTWLF